MSAQTSEKTVRGCKRALSLTSSWFVRNRALPSHRCPTRLCISPVLLVEKAHALKNEAVPGLSC
jgi:hypothetical protein